MLKYSRFWTLRAKLGVSLIALLIAPGALPRYSARCLAALPLAIILAFLACFGNRC